MARPRKEINFDTLKKLCGIYCTKDEICSFFEVDEKTLSARIEEEYGESFSDYYKKASAEGSASLRRKQFELALGGNVTMLIWLGKNVLRQSDRVLVEPPAPAGQTNFPRRKMSFTEFCTNAGYPAPFEKQIEMKEFGVNLDGARLILGSRGYGKTDYVVILGIAYEIYLDPSYTSLIVTKSDKRNTAMLREIANALLAAGVELDVNNSTTIRVKGLLGKDDSCSSATINSVTLRGRHPRIIVLDDPVTPEDSSESVRRKAKTVYNECMKLKMNLLLIGQPVHKFDLYQELRGVIKTLEVPYGSIPELDVDLEAQRLAGVDESTIQASYFLKVVSEGTVPFDNINYMESFPEGGDSVAFIDPAFGGKDFTSATIMRAYGQGIAVHGRCWRKSWEHCLEDMEKDFSRYGVKRAAFEINCTGEQPLGLLRKALKCGVVGVRSNTNKHSRILAAATFAHMLHLSRQSDKEYIRQVIQYEEKSKNDDAPDSLASGLKWLGLIRGKE
jgi:hypothetical protein